jgi:putative effector of murein hydrolase
MADTLNYFVAGYVVIFGLLGAYIGWLVLLNRRIKKKMGQGSGK